MLSPLTPLPIDPYLKAIVESFSQCPVLILTATPGAGKSTRLPPELLKVTRGGKIAVLEPRRIAATATALRIAEERQWTLGKEVGYQVRGASEVSKETALVFMTEGVLLRRLIDDPELSEFAAVVIDEFHERSLNQDLLMGLLRELQEMGRGIKLVIMSATLDPAPLLSYWPGSKHIEVPGEVHPLEIRYSQRAQSLKTDRDFYARVVQAVGEADKSCSGDILVFLPGLGEIQKTQRELEHPSFAREICPLHGSLSLGEQKKILQPGPRPRVILATNVAEASVTVPGIRWVIDSGLAKYSDFNWDSGFSRLNLGRISKFSATQRAGRAARTAPGTCHKLWNLTEESSFAEQSKPEVMRSDLSTALMWLSYMGVRDFPNFSWFEPPPLTLVTRATKSLVQMGAFDADHRLTSLGRQMLTFPLSPHAAALTICGSEQGHKDLAMTAALVIEETDFLRDSPGDSGTESDLGERLSLLGSSDRNSYPVNASQLRRIRQSMAQLGVKSYRYHPDDHSVLLRLLFQTHTDRLCRRRGHSLRGLMKGGRGVQLDPASEVKNSEFFFALKGMDIPGHSETRISLAVGAEREDLLQALGDRIVVQSETEFDPEKGVLQCKRWRAFDDLPLENPQVTNLMAEEQRKLWPEILLKHRDKLLAVNSDLDSWISRWEFWTTWMPETKTHFTEDHWRQLTELACYQKSSWQEITRTNWVALLEPLLDQEELRRFQKELPSHFTAPSGSKVPIQYEDHDRAYVDIRLQEIFGLPKSPLILGGRLALTFRLLGPNYRPAQVTSDLENFWQNGYPEVRKELRSRYPKHAWPDNPLTATPEAKGKRRRP